MSVKGKLELYSRFISGNIIFLCYGNPGLFHSLYLDKSTNYPTDTVAESLRMSMISQKCHTSLLTIEDLPFGAERGED